jgi:hypothetical protein
VCEPAVLLTVGQVYVFEVVRTSATGYAMIRGAQDDPCPDIQAWIEGKATATGDLWFQLGSTSTVAGADRSWSTLKALYEPLRAGSVR